MGNKTSEKAKRTAIEEVFYGNNSKNVIGANKSALSNKKLFTLVRYQPDSSGVITQSGPSLVSFQPNTHLERRNFTKTLLLCCSTEAACDSPPTNLVLRIASDRPRALAKREAVYRRYISTSKVPSGVKHDAIDNCGEEMPD